MSVSLDDLNDALNDDVGGAATTTTDNDSESDFKECSSGAYGEELRSRKKMTTSLNVKFDEDTKTTERGGGGGGGMSVSAIGIGSGSTSESSVGNSPNPKKNS